jgi:nucleoside-diphosphate-sugar epimerase
MKILLTGASGFLGSHTAQELTRRGHSLTVLVRKTSKLDALQNLNLRYVEGALPDCSGLQPVLNEVDVVVHVAGIVKALSQNEFRRVNANGTANLVEAILSAPRRPRLFIHISSIAVHNPAVDGPDFCLSSDRCHPLSHYGFSKLQGELSLQKLKGKISTQILRPPVLYGPGDKELLPMFKLIRRGLAPVYGAGENRLSLCFVEDVARAIADLAESPPSPDSIFCLDDGSPHTWRSISTDLAKLMEKNPRILPLPPFLFRMGALASQSYAQITRQATVFTLNKLREMGQPNWICGYQKLNESLGWSPRMALREGLRKTLNYYQETGLLG